MADGPGAHRHTSTAANQLLQNIRHLLSYGAMYKFCSCMSPALKSSKGDVISDLHTPLELTRSPSVAHPRPTHPTPPHSNQRTASPKPSHVRSLLQDTIYHRVLQPGHHAAGRECNPHWNTRRSRLCDEAAAVVKARRCGRDYDWGYDIGAQC
jgi:hypothetical protein